MNEYKINFKGTMLVRAEDEDEAQEYLDDLHYGISEMLLESDIGEFYNFAYDWNTFREG